ncbi:MAG: flagellar filament capping protein FliD [Syntrophobacterales bacterium]|nr:flagellar filament capping protein FliD [Syntrophobacterales bacterium]
MADTTVTAFTTGLFYQPAITFTGLGSGIDSQTMINRLVEVEGRQLRRFSAWKEEWLAKIEALSALQEKLRAFRTVAAGMDSPGEFQVRQVSVSAPGVLQASAAPGAALGTHQLLIQQLAQNEVEVHQGLPGADTVVNGSGSPRTLALTYAGTTFTVTVPAGATLTDLAAAINASSANPGVKALVLDLGPAAGETRFRLMLQGRDTGAASTIAVDDALTTLNGADGTLDFTAAAFTETQSAANAQLRLNGYPPEGWIERPANLITDLIPGVSLTLTAVSATPVTLTVAPDTAAMQEKITTLVEKYNEVAAYIRELTRFDPVSKKAGLLLGNYVVQIVKSGLTQAATGNAPGFASPPDRFLNLAQVGITTDADPASPTFGQLKLDEAALSLALREQPEAVGELFGAALSGVSDDATGTISYISALPGITRPGIYRVTATVQGGILTGGTINGHPALVSGDTLTGAAGYPEYGLAVRVALTDGDHDGVVRLKSGLSRTLGDRLDGLLSLATGPVHILIKNYQDIINGIDDKIELETRRLEAYRQRLTEQFARLEAVLGQLNDQANYLAGQIQKMNNTKS